jgi:hypothetical protein
MRFWLVKKRYLGNFANLSIDVTLMKTSRQKNLLQQNISTGLNQLKERRLLC